MIFVTFGVLWDSEELVEAVFSPPPGRQDGQEEILSAIGEKSRCSLVLPVSGFESPKKEKPRHRDRVSESRKVGKRLVGYGVRQDRCYQAGLAGEPGGEILLILFAQSGSKARHNRIAARTCLVL